MRWPRIAFLSILALLAVGFLNYTLPDRDIVRVTGTEIFRTDLSGWNRIFYASSESGSASTDIRDVRLINTTRPGDDAVVSVYRNEDTGLGWPPYFKFASQDLQAEALDLVSTSDDPQWVVVTHYGWRSNFFSAYPNAIAIRPIDDPETRLFPWMNVLILLGIGLALLAIWRLWERFEDYVIEPIVDRVAVRWAKTRDWMAGRR
ncbi:MAG: DUF1523 family protein [Pseudomonadota bacterium]